MKLDESFYKNYKTLEDVRNKELDEDTIKAVDVSKLDMEADCEFVLKYSSILEIKGHSAKDVMKHFRDIANKVLIDRGEDPRW